MLRYVLIGAAGAVGATALNATTYANMVVRGRPFSSVPARVADEIVGKARTDLSGEGQDDETAQNLKSGLGALLGIGLGIGGARGLVRPYPERISLPRATVVLGFVAKACRDIPSAAPGVTDPSQWGHNAWLSDLVPQLAYGLAADEASGQGGCS